MTGLKRGMCPFLDMTQELLSIGFPRTGILWWETLSRAQLKFVSTSLYLLELFFHRFPASGAGSIFMQPFCAGAAWKFGKEEFGIVGWISDDFCKAASLPRIKTKTSILVLALDTERWIFIPKKSMERVWRWPGCATGAECNVFLRILLGSRCAGWESR